MISIKHKVLHAGVISLLILVLNSTNAYANSSWHWLTASPLTVLPFAVIITLLIEAISIYFFCNIRNIKRVFAIISLANLVSFLAPYMERAYRFIPTTGSFSILSAADKGPYYIVLTGYLLLTIVVELPIVYLLLKKEASNIKRLITTIVVSNIVTTAIVAVCERLICIGQW